MVSNRAATYLVGFILAFLALVLSMSSRPTAQAISSATALTAANVPDPVTNFSPSQDAQGNDEPGLIEQAAIWSIIDRNRADLREQGILPMGGERIVGFDLPLRTTQPSDVQPWFIANHVDHNLSFPSAKLDYNCGARTYDSASGYNHKGTDFFLWPHPWKQMADETVEVVAAAPAVIVHKEDGGYDRQCSITGARWNAVYVEHADGSVGWYGHLKNGSLTEKAVGDTLARGERIGFVGSSGNSTGPHLHFEVYDESNQLVDPFSGSCNYMNDKSWWIFQEPYELPSITGMIVGTALVDASGCGIEERTFEQDSYAPNSKLYFTLYYRDRASNLTAQARLLRPDGSEFTSWSHADSGDYWNATYTYAARTVGSEAGVWTYEVMYNDKVYQREFVVGAREEGAAAPTAVQVTALQASPAVQSGIAMSVGSMLSVVTGILGLSKFESLCACLRVTERDYQAKTFKQVFGHQLVKDKEIKHVR